MFTVRSGNIYYVSSSGDNSTGAVNDIEHPYRAPNYAHDRARFGAGDFIVVRGGAYEYEEAANNPPTLSGATISGVTKQ